MSRLFDEAVLSVDCINSASEDSNKNRHGTTTNSATEDALLQIEVWFTNCHRRSTV